MATISEALAIAVQHHQAGQLQAAEQICRQVLAVDPSHVDGLHLLGIIALEMGKHEIAVEYISRAIELNEAESTFHCNLGTAFQAQAKLDEAVASFRRALELKPNDAVVYYNLGNAYQAQGQFDQAVASYLRAAELKPDYAVALNNLGNAFLSQGRLDEAIASYRRAVELKPDYAMAHSNSGHAFKSLRRFDNAFSSYARALELDADCPYAHFGQSTLRLLQGNFESAWPEYEWRWNSDDLVQRAFSQPRWDGNLLDKRTILLHAEQGLGDTIQFVRYAGLVKKQNEAANVIVECQRSLEKLLATCPGIDRLIAGGDDLPRFDVHSPLLSLPGIVKTTIETIPANVPYLFADPTLVAEWRERLSNVSGLRIGINWLVRTVQGAFRHRNIPLEHFAALAQLPGISLVSLQKGRGRDELLSASKRLPILDLGDDVDTAHGAFMDTAAIMKNLDLVITSDTAIPHLAGALGVPVWLALPFVPDWRWLLDRTDSPWYPTMRLFRQRQAGDWAGMFEEIRAALHEMMLRQ